MGDFFEELAGRVGEVTSPNLKDRVLAVLARVFAAYGQVEKALSMLDRVEDGLVSVCAGLSVAEVLGWRGFTDEARSVLSYFAGKVDEHGGGESLALKLAYSKTITEGVEEGLSVAAVEDDYLRCQAALGVAAALMEEGKPVPKNVLKVMEEGIRGVLDEEAKVGLLLEAGRILAKVGMMDEARGMIREAERIARSLYHEFSRRMALLKVMSVMVEAEMLPEALALSNSLGVTSLHYLEEAAEKAGVEAVRLAEGLEGYGKAFFMLRGAEVSLNREVILEAAREVERLAGSPVYTQLAVRLAAVQAKAGMVKEAEETIRRASGAARGVELVKIADVFVMIGRVGEAEKLLEQACNEVRGMRKERRLFLMMDAGATWSRVGKVEEALRCFDEAVRIIGEMPGGGREVIGKLSRRIASSSIPWVALRAAGSLQRVEDGLALLTFTIKALTEFGRTDDAERMACVLPLLAGKAGDRASATRLLLEAASTLARGGLVDAASRLTSEILKGVVGVLEEGGMEEFAEMVESAAGLVPIIGVRRGESGEAVLFNRGGPCFEVGVFFEEPQGGVELSLRGVKGGEVVKLRVREVRGGRNVKLRFRDVFGWRKCLVRVRG